jgi:hypothetical protein
MSFKKEMGFGLVCEVNECIVRIKDGEKVIQEVVCTSYLHARLTAIRIENEMMRDAAAMSL